MTSQKARNHRLPGNDFRDYITYRGTRVVRVLAAPVAYSRTMDIVVSLLVDIFLTVVWPCLTANERWSVARLAV